MCAVFIYFGTNLYLVPNCIIFSFLCANSCSLKWREMDARLYILAIFAYDNKC